MHFFGFTCLLIISTVYSLPVESDSVSGLQPQPATTRLFKLLRDKRSPAPDPHHRSRLHGHIHLHGYYSEPSYEVNPVIQPVVVKPVPVIKPVVVKQPVPVVQPVVVKPVPVVQPVVVKPVYTQPVAAGGCNVCGGGGGGYGGGSQSQASSHASSNSFSAGLNSPYGNLGFSSSSAQSSAQAGSAGYGK